MDEKKLQEISEHLFYEIDMLNITAVKVNNSIRKKIFSQDKGDSEGAWRHQIEINCYLDSFAIHARNLIEFFCGKTIEGKNYVRAEHFLESEKIQEFKRFIHGKKSLLKYVMDKTNHQVVHLTFDRIEPRFQGISKTWDLKKIDQFNQIIKKILDMVDEKLLCNELIKWKKNEQPFHAYISRYAER